MIVGFTVLFSYMYIMYFDLIHLSLFSLVPLTLSPISSTSPLYFQVC